MTCPCGSTETIQKSQGRHIGEYCASCNRWFRWVPQDWRKFIWPVGIKHKGHTLAAILLNDRPYLVWASENMNGTLQKRAQEALASTKDSGTTKSDPEEQDTVDHISRHFNSSSDEPRTEELPW